MDNQPPSPATLIKLLSNPSNLELLLLLSTKPSYTRELARLTGKSESEVSRRLRALERAGVVVGEWKRIEGRSVRVYRLAVSEFRLRISDGQLIITPQGGGGGRPLQVRLATFRPPRVGLVVGREREAALLRDPPTPVVVVWGISGIGKTSLAAYALEGLPRVFWHTPTRMDSAEFLLWRLGLFLSSLGMPELLNYLGSPGARPELGADVAVESLRDTGARLVFDDFQEIEGSLAGEIVTRIALEADGYYVYVLSRVRPRSLRRVPATRRTEIYLSGLDLESSLALLERLGARLGEREAREAYEVTSGHPMLLTLLARSVEKGGRGARQITLDYLWGELYESLTPREKRILLALSAFDEPIPAGLVGSITGILDPAPYLYRLRDKGIVEAYDTGFRAHQLVRSILGGVDRGRYYLLAAAYFESTGGWPDRMRAIRYYLLAGRPERAAMIIAERVRRDDYRYITHIHAYTGIVEEVARHRLEPGLSAYVRHDLALTRRMQSRMSEALVIIDGALGLAGLAGDIVVEAALRSEKSYILSDLGRPDEAVEEAVQAEELARRAGNLNILFGAIANHAKALATRGEYEASLEAIREEARIASLIGDPFYILWSHIHLAEAYQLLGDLDKARGELEYVLSVAEDLGLTHPLFFVALVYSSILEMEGDWKALLEWASKADKLLGELGMGHRSCRPKYYRARALAGLGRKREALLEARWALEIAERSEDHEAARAIRSLIEELEAELATHN